MEIFMKNDKKTVAKTTKPVTKKVYAKKNVAKKTTAKKVVAKKVVAPKQEAIVIVKNKFGRFVPFAVAIVVIIAVTFFSSM